MKSTQNLVNLNVPMPGYGGLSCVGIIWTLLSIIATGLIVGGVLTPEWLVGHISSEGKSVVAYFGTYKRCNYPIYDKDNKKVALLSECGRYESFTDIPSLFWQLSILSAAAGSCLSLLLVLLLIPSLCMKDIVSSSSAIIIGFFQVIAALFVSASLILYPLGWDNQEVKDACGPTAERFNLGMCKLGRAYLSLVVGAAMLVFCSLLSICGGRKIHRRFDMHRDNLINGYDHARLDIAK